MLAVAAIGAGLLMIASLSAATASFPSERRTLSRSRCSRRRSASSYRRTSFGVSGFNCGTLCTRPSSSMATNTRYALAT